MDNFSPHAIWAFEHKMRGPALLEVYFFCVLYIEFRFCQFMKAGNMMFHDHVCGRFGVGSGSIPYTCILCMKRGLPQTYSKDSPGTSFYLLMNLIIQSLGFNSGNSCYLNGQRGIRKWFLYQ